jgi:site-specific DNA-methyltransferase (adenine-specific)
VAKASKRDRNEGLDQLDEKPSTKQFMSGVEDEGNNVDGSIRAFADPVAKNFHPTVKPTSLMEYLIKLVTPPNGTVLDPFTGSGSTGKAAILQGFDFIGIELTEEYLPIIHGRLNYAEQLVAEAEEQEKLKETEKLF